MRAVAKYPSLKAFAGELGVPYQTVQQWLKNGVPIKYCPQIEKITGGDVLCEDLNSEFDWTYLRATAKPLKPPRTRTRAPPKQPTVPP